MSAGIVRAKIVLFKGDVNVTDEEVMKARLQTIILQHLEKEYFGNAWRVESVDLYYEPLKKGADNGCTQKEVEGKR